MRKKVFSLLVGLALCVSLLPPAAFAENESIEDVLQNEEVQTEEIAEQVQFAAEQEDEPAEFAANADDEPQGEGTAEAPYLIGSLNELKWFRDTVNGGASDICAKLTETKIKLDDAAWEPIGTETNPYTGIFDGSCREISIDYAKAPADMESGWGLFGYIGNGGKVQDLNVIVNYFGWDYGSFNVPESGIMAAYNDGTIERCSVLDNRINVTGSVGLLVYRNNGTVRDCITRIPSDISAGAASIGGVVYLNNGSIENCFFYNSNYQSTNAMYNHAIAFEKGSGSSIANCYYKENSPAVDNTEGVKAVTIEDVRSGKLTVMLNNSGDAQGSRTEPWRIDSNKIPGLKRTDSRVRYEDGNYVIEGKPHMHGDQEFTKVTALSDITEDGYYCVDSDIGLESTWEVGYKVTLCLNGKTITADSAITAINIDYRSSLTLLDCSKNNAGKITGGKLGVWDGGEFIMQGGEITGNTTGVYVSMWYITLGGKAKITGNDKNIMLSSGKMIHFDALDPSAKFGISVKTQDELKEDERVTVTDENGGQYLGQLVADGFKEDGTGFELYLSDDGTAVTLGRQSVHTHCICGTGYTNSGHDQHEDITFKPWTGTDSLPSEGNYYLTRNVTLSGANLKNANICLNGYTVTLPRTARIEAGINQQTNLQGSLTDCIGKGTVEGGFISILFGGTVNLYGGTLKGSYVSIKQSGGTFNMYGGKITDNETTYAAVDGQNNNKIYVNMYGGEISGNCNTREDGGGAVYIGQGNKFGMYGGKIIGNSAKKGGGVYIAAAGNTYGSGTFTVSGGEISGNMADEKGGGVYVEGTFNVSGSTEIQNNTVNGSQNNVYLQGGRTNTIVDKPLGTIGVTASAVPEDGKPVKIAAGGGDYIIKEYDKDHFIPDAGDTYRVNMNGNALELSVPPHEHPVTTGESGVTWQPIGSEEALQNITNTSGEPAYYYLTKDIELNAAWNPASGVVLDLNSHSITAKEAFDTIIIGDGISFTLTDCKGGSEDGNYGSVTHYQPPNPTKSRVSGHGVYVSSGGSFTMYGGCIGPNLMNVVDVPGAGVYVAEGAKFTMLGGDISGNMVSAAVNNNGGGIWTAGETTIGGNTKITGNSALKGGGAYVDSGTLTLEGNAKITDNYARSSIHGGGIFVGTNGRLCVSGSVQVTENYGTGSAIGNVRLEANGGSVTPIIVSGELTAASIGVSVPDDVLNTVDEDNSVTVAEAATDGRIKDGSFINENGSTYAVIVSGDGKTALLGIRPHKWKYTANVSGVKKSISAQCTECDKYCSVSLPYQTYYDYNGNEQGPEADYENFKWVADEVNVIYKQGDTVLSGRPKAVGSYTASITLGEGSNEVSITRDFEIRPGLLDKSDVEIELPTDAVYDGKTNWRAAIKKMPELGGDGTAELMYYKVEPDPNNPGSELYGYTWDNVIEAGTYAVKINLNKSTNYMNSQVPINREDYWRFTVSKASVEDPAAVNFTVYNGAANTYEIELPSLPLLPDSCEYGNITYGAPSVIMDNGYLDMSTGAKIENGKLIMPILANATTAENKIGQVSVKVETDNYQDITLTVNFEAKNQIVPTGEPVLDKKEITYGDKISSISLSGMMHDNVNHVDVSGTFKWNTDGTPPAGTCLAGWTFTPDDIMYTKASGNAEFTVNKANIPADAITPPTAADIVYDGNAHELIAEGNTKIGTMQYRLGNDGAWENDIPKATDAGSYEVYYQVLGNENYNDTAEQKIECNIAKRPVTISNKPGDEGYKTEYMYGDIIQPPKPSNFEITGSEGNPNVSCQWIGEEPKMYSKIGTYTLKVTVAATANTAGGSLEIPVKIERNTSDVGYNSGFDYMVYNNTDTVSYDIDFVDGVDSHATMIDRESLTLKTNDFIIVVKDADGNYNSYDKDNCDFKISVEEGAAKGTVRVTLTGLNRDTASGYSFCMIGIQAENMHYANIDIQLRLYVQEKRQQTLGVAMGSFTYGDNAGTPAYTAPEGTLKTSVIYAKKDGTKLAEAPTAAGDYTVTVVCETKDTIYSGSADYSISLKPISDVTIKLSEDKFIYSGGEQKPMVTLEMNGKDLAESKDYTVIYPNDMTNAGTKEIKILGIGNFSGEKTVSYQINKATIKVKPKDISKVYGDEPKFKLESKSSLITEQELETFANAAKFTSDGAAKTAPVTADGYKVSAQLAEGETDNLILEVDGTGILKVEKASLTITVKDVSREYGAANPELEAVYSGFVNGEDESVLSGKLVLKYDSSINEQTVAGSYPKAAKAEGLTSGNYNINYVEGNVNITKIKVNASAGSARKSYLDVVFDKNMEGLAAQNFIVKDSEGNEVAVSGVTASSDGKTYTLRGSYATGREYTVKVVLSGAGADATHELSADEFVIKPVRRSSSSVSGGSGAASATYTVSFDTNGGSELSNQTVAQNSAIQEPEAPVKEGFDFAGWYTDKELKEKYDFSAKVTENITLYAAWTEKDNSVNQIILTIGEKDAVVFGMIKTNDVAPKIVNDRTMLPARFVAENLGAEVLWDGEKGLVTVKGKNSKTSEDVTILIYIGSDIAYVNGKEIKLDSSAFIENDRTYTPVRFIFEELGASVEWIDSARKVVITR